MNSTTSSLAAIVVAPYRDEATLERAAKAARFYRALADAIEADPELAPNLVPYSDYVVSVNATLHAIGEEENRHIFHAARRLPGSVVAQESYNVSVDAQIAGVPTRFQCIAHHLGSKRTVTRTVEVEEYVLDEDGAA